MVGQFGEILHTLDGGKTWKFQRSGTQANLNKVYFADANHGLIVGDEGVILTTINGGMTWESQNSGTSNDLYSFSLSPDGILAVGEGGIAMRYSVDTEKFIVELPPAAQEMETDEKPIEAIKYHWEIVRQGNWQAEFTDTYFLSAQHGWTVGSDGTILRTTDGGKTWQPQQSGVSETLQRIVFIDEKYGWISGQGVLLRTENGGKSWQVIRNGLKNFHNIRAIHFINPKEGWLGVDRGQILRTSDGGKTWTLQQTGTTHQPITDLHFINSKEGWAVAPQRRTGGFILHTVDGGDYWEIQAKTHHGSIGVHFLDATSGWVVMEDGTSLLTTDGGESWKRDLEAEQDIKGSNLDIQLLTVKFRNHTEAWAIDGGHTILTTQNQGKNWEVTYSYSLPERETANGESESWIERMAADRSFGFSIRITNAHFLPNGHGWIVAGEQIYDRELGADVGGSDESGASTGQIYATTDGGKTWQHQLGEPLDNFRDVQFLDEQNGWIAGDNGVLLSTEDGGENWKRLESGTTDRIVDVHFISLDPKWGWAMERDGTLLYTIDGEDWSIDDKQELPERFLPDLPQHQLPPLSINEVAFGNFSEGWAVGENGDIIHNLDGGPIWKFQRTSTGKNLTSVDMKFAPSVGQSGLTVSFSELSMAVNIGSSMKRTQATTFTPYRSLRNEKDGLSDVPGLYCSPPTVDSLGSRS